ncbi:2-oxoacid:acceptor oxidoreductase family protein [Desulforhopalus sp. 52FAK]
MINERVLCAGFGGQGVMSLGQLLAYAGMLEGLHVSWLPSYGPEMRGGTAYCCVMLSEEPVGSPVIAGDATCAIIMNLPSLIKFEPALMSGGLLFLNSSMADKRAERDDIDVYYIPAGDLAQKCGDDRAANMVMLGAYLGIMQVVDKESLEKAFARVFGEKSEKLLPLNLKAITCGMEYVNNKETLNRAA